MRGASSVVLIVGSLEIGRRVQDAFARLAGTFGLSWTAEICQPRDVPADLPATIRRIVVLAPAVTDGLPTERTERWEATDPGAIDAGVNRLLARLLGGGGEPPKEPEPTLPEPAKGGKVVKPVVKVGRETKGRKGKGVTTIAEVPLEAMALQELATQLKTRCGTGGSVEDGVIVLQGDQRERVTPVLEALGYKVKRVGG